MIISGLDKISAIAARYHLPDWWVGSVAVEYFNCRLHTENGFLWGFSFDKLNDKEVRAIPEKKIVSPGFTIIQNIRCIDLIARMRMRDMGLPVVDLEDAGLVPEGPINNTGFAYDPAILYSYDYKLAFGPKAMVRDNGSFYQWDIEKMKRYYQDKSDPIDLLEFSKLQELLKYQYSPMMTESDLQFKIDVEGGYKALERVRKKLRQKILDYHNDKKKHYDASWTKVSEPPMLSYFDTIKLTKEGYKVRTQMAPLFLRSAVRNLCRAEDAKKKLDSNQNDHDALLDELEYSAMCIISAANCLEEYINYVISMHLPNESKIFDDNAGHKQKWLWVPAALGLSFRFKPNEKPYSNFLSLVRWRNDTIHHKTKYRKTKGRISYTYNQLNIKNARTAVRVVRDMVTKLSKDDVIPLPRWIETDVGSALYWDEVSDYLRKMQCE